ncbi:glycoside hydrolase [Russula compacta]|nr:glycoside hydrolase [Russula compacta]
MSSPCAFLLLLSTLALVAATYNPPSDRAVLSHFIFGNTYSYQTQDWEYNFQLASKSGIDSLVFNIAQDSWTEQQLDAAFKAAPKYSTKICFSFDFAVASWTTSSVISSLERYVGMPAYFKYQGSKGGGKALVSTFDGPARANVDWTAVKAAVPNIYVVPHLSIDEVEANPPGIDGALNWNAWATQNNLPINGNASTVDDHIMQNALGATKAYATLVSPWSFTNYHAYGVNKEWIFKSDDLLVTRWNQMLTFAESAPGAHIDLVELYSWNDYGESNYQNDITKAYSNEFSGGDDAWSMGFKHDGWRLLNIPFIKAFKAYHTSVSTADIDTEMVVFYHRPYPADTLCAGQSQPVLGASFVPDQVTIVSTLHSPVQLTVKSGGHITKANAAAGVQTNHVPMQLGAQSVTVTRNGKTCGQVTSAVQVKNSCSTPNYNANVEYIIVKC